jgi:ribosome-dependent ATPase
MTDSEPHVSSAASASTPVVSIKDVTRRYGGAVALDGLSLDIPSGIMVGIIGPDGVGKSTLMALIAGSKKMQEGRVIVLGGDIANARHRREACPRIAYMPQGLGKNLYFELSVQENVDFIGYSAFPPRSVRPASRSCSMRPGSDRFPRVPPASFRGA